MATKSVAVLEHEVPEIPMAELASSATSFDWTIPTLSSDVSLRPAHVPPPELDNYQIALVPSSGGKGATGNMPHGGRVGRLLLLPLTWKELMARVRGALSHSDSSPQNKTVRFGRVSIDFRSMEVSRAERPVSLTAMEFKVLKFFVLSPNRVISRDELLNEVWGYDNYPWTRTVDNHVLKLRQKLESDPGKPVHFRTVHGIGYKFIP